MRAVAATPPSQSGNGSSRIGFGQIDAQVKLGAYDAMGADQHQDWAALAASALEWWRDAGVDLLVEDVPRDWRAKPEVVAPVVSAGVAQTMAERLPDDLAAFAAWRIGGLAPEHGGHAPLLPAEGDPSAELMVVVDCPGEDGVLDGAAGRLFDRMLAAIGLERARIYLVPLCATRPLGGRIAPELHGRLSELLHHQIALSRPKRILALGQAPSRALLGTNGAPGDGSLHAVNLNGTTVNVVASQPPRLLLERPLLKAEAWRDLRMLMGGER